MLLVCGSQNSLGGNAMTALIVTVASEASYASESLSTLQFGSRAKLIPVKATVNEVVDYKGLYEALQAKLDAGEDTTTSMGITVQALEAKLAQLQRDYDAAQKVRPSLRLEPRALSGHLARAHLMLGMLRLLVRGRCINIWRGKGWHCRKRGTQAT
jgi:kinesin family protein 15